MSKRDRQYLARVQSAARRQVLERQQTHTQMCVDAAMMACNDMFNMGPTRAPLWVDKFKYYLNEIAGMTVADTADMEYTKAKVDGRLQKICGDNFQPWDERYG